jgi:hypothetical protein
MRYLASFVAILVLTSGCALVFDDGGDDDICLLAAAEPAIAPAPQRNPETLTCEAFGGGCSPECGPCPEIALAPSPSWGFCGSTCDALSETACAQNAGCRVVKDARCAVSADCATDFVGCFPTDQLVDPSIDCFAARDGWTCSQSAGCTAYHRGGVNGLEPVVTRTFAMCAPEGQSPGTCYGAVACERVAPPCPAQTKPGVANGCYTGACIPLDICGPAPQQ